MDSKEEQQVGTGKQEFVLKRINGVLLFFLSLFGALAALGFFFMKLEYPNWELYFQLGFVGTAATLVILGSLQLGRAFLSESILQRITNAARFFLGLFGALLTLGTFFALLEYPNAALFLQLGLGGTMVALPVNGLLKLVEVMAMEAPDEEDSGGL